MILWQDEEEPYPIPTEPDGRRKNANASDAATTGRCSHSGCAPEGDDWLHEIKYDGYRTLCFVDGSEARLLTRNGHGWSDRYQPIGAILSKPRCDQAIVDGEICVQDETGVTSFAALQDALGNRAPERLTYFVFDLLYLNGFDLTKAPLIQRKRELKSLLKGVRDPVQYSDHVIGDGPTFFEQAEKLSPEGIVSKRVNAPYRPGKGRSWLKTKITKEENFLVVGYTESAGGLSSLLLAERSKDGSLKIVGRVGTGMSLKEAALLLQALRKISLKRPPKHLQPDGPVGRPPGVTQARGTPGAARRLQSSAYCSEPAQ